MEKKKENINGNEEIKEEKTAEQEEKTEEKKSEAKEKPSHKKENKEAAELKDKLLRTMAEFDNYKKRTSKEKDSLYQFSVAETVGKFLPVLDNLKLALNNKSEDENLRKGVELTVKQFEDVLNKLGVEEIKSVGEIFDPNMHHAVLHVDDDKYKAQEIVEVMQSGYTLNGNVIRYAMVKVAN